MEFISPYDLEMVEVLGIFGFSGFAREVADVAAAMGMRPIFIVRKGENLTSSQGSHDVLLEENLQSSRLRKLAIGVGDPEARARIAARYAGGYDFPPLIHPSVTFGLRQRPRVLEASGSILCAGVRITNNVIVGNFTILNLNVTVGHDVELGSYVTVSPGANISGNVRIDHSVQIGSGAVIKQGEPDNKLEIGSRVIVGANSTVLKSCAAGGVYVGSPATRLR